MPPQIRTLPISEQFARVLFDGPEQTFTANPQNVHYGYQIWNRNNNAIEAVGVTPPGDIMLWVENRFNTIREEIRPQFTEEFGITLFPRHILRTGFTIYASLRNIADFYGKWDDLGPRLILEMKVPKVNEVFQLILDAFMEDMKAFDELVSGQMNISTRMALAEPNAIRTIYNPNRPGSYSTSGFGSTIGSPNLRNFGPGRAGLPENILQSIIKPLLQNKKDPVTPLSRLVKKGGRKSRRRQRKSRASYSRKAT